MSGPAPAGIDFNRDFQQDRHRFPSCFSAGSASIPTLPFSWTGADFHPVFQKDKHRPSLFPYI
jgi:hypothetical protein